MEGRSVMCALMSGIALEQMGGFQLSYMEGINLSQSISKLNLVPSYVSGPFF